jgi:hypothetical protein
VQGSGGFVFKSTGGTTHDFVTSRVSMRVFGTIKLIRPNWTCIAPRNGPFRSILIELLSVIPQESIRASISPEALIAEIVAGVFLGNLARGIDMIISQIIISHFLYTDDKRLACTSIVISTLLTREISPIKYLVNDNDFYLTRRIVPHFF